MARPPIERAVGGVPSVTLFKPVAAGCARAVAKAGAAGVAAKARAAGKVAAGKAGAEEVTGAAWARPDEEFLLPGPSGRWRLNNERSLIDMSDTNGKTVRIAVPSEAPGGLTARRSGHFGRCECLTVVDGR